MPSNQSFSKQAVFDSYLFFMLPEILVTDFIKKKNIDILYLYYY